MKQLKKTRETQIAKEKIKELPEESLYANTLESTSPRHFKQIKYFSVDGSSMPNGIGLQRGGFLHECKKNSENFLINKEVHKNQNGLSDYKGGIVVLSADVNAVSLDANTLKNKIKQIIATFNQGHKAKNVLNNVADKFNKYKERKNYIGAYSIDNAFRGKYVGDNGEEYSENSTTIQVNGLSPTGLLRFGEMIAKIFHQETVLVKDFNDNKIYLAKGLGS